MNVLWVTPGGLEPSTGRIIPALYDLFRVVASRQALAAVTFEEANGPQAYRIDGASVRAAARRGRPGWQNSAACWRAMSALHRKHRFDLVHAFWGSRAGAIAVAWGRVHRVPVMVSLFGGEPVSFPELGYGGWRGPRSRASVRFAVRGADCVTAGSSYLIDRFREVGLDLPWVRWSIGVDQRPFREAASRRSSTLSEVPTLLSVADLGPIKDHGTMLEVVARVARRRPVRLLVAGDPRPAGSLEPRLAALGIADRARFLGKVPHDRLPELYRDADLLLHTSRHEGEGIVFLEAAAAGCPIVSTAVGLVPEMAARGAARQAAPGDVDGLAQAVEALLSDDRAREAQAEAARAYAAGFDLPQVAERLMDLYRRFDPR